MYHVAWIALFSAYRWRLDVLTFLIKGFGFYDNESLFFDKEKLCDFESVSVYSVDPNINSVITPLTSQYTNSPIQA